MDWKSVLTESNILQTKPIPKDWKLSKKKLKLYLINFNRWKKYKLEGIDRNIENHNIKSIIDRNIKLKQNSLAMVERNSDVPEIALSFKDGDVIREKEATRIPWFDFRFKIHVI